MPDHPTVFVVDDDRGQCELLTSMLASVGLRAMSWHSAEEFLEHNLAPYIGPRCLLLDIRMPGLSGLALQQRLAQRGVDIPIIFLTGVNDVGTAVQAIKAGAVDFIEKPVHRQLLIERVEHALDVDAQAAELRQRRRDVQARLALLSGREQEVLRLLVNGRSSKEIASALDVSIATVTRHRLRVLHKMQARSVVELVKLMEPLPAISDFEKQSSRRTG